MASTLDLTCHLGDGAKSMTDIDMAIQKCILFYMIGNEYLCKNGSISSLGIRVDPNEMFEFICTTYKCF